MKSFHSNPPITPHFVRVDLIDRSTIWARTRALEQSGDVTSILNALDRSGWLFADRGGARTWYGIARDPALDQEKCGAELCLVLLSLSVSPEASLANLHLDIAAEC
jgi:hypothetical protein